MYVDQTQSTAESVVLRDLKLESSGKYRCEVSVDAPSFHTVTNQSYMFIVAMPDEGPQISNADLVNTLIYKSSTAQTLINIEVYVAVALVKVLLL